MRVKLSHFKFRHKLMNRSIVASEVVFIRQNRDLAIIGRQRDGDGQNKLLQINGSKDSSSYIINRMNLIQS